MQRLPTIPLLVALLMLGSAPALCRKAPSPASEFIPAVEAILQNEDDPLDHIKILMNELPMCKEDNAVANMDLSVCHSLRGVITNITRDEPVHQVICELDCAEQWKKMGDEHHECLRDIFTNLADPKSRFVNVTMQYFAACIAQNTATSLGFGRSPDSRSSLFNKPSARHAESPRPALEIEEPTRIPESDKATPVVEPVAVALGNPEKASSSSPAVEPQDGDQVKSSDGPESEDEEPKAEKELEGENSEEDDTPASESTTPSPEEPILNWGSVQNITEAFMGTVSNIFDNLTPTEQDRR